MSEKRIRVLVAKTGLESHTKGMEIVSRWLQEAGMEVIYLGTLQTVDKVVMSALQEDVDVIGLSFLGGQHLVQTSKLFKRMSEKGVNVPVVVGGVIPREDAYKLKEMGVKEVFLPGSSMGSIVDCVKELAA